MKNIPIYILVIIIASSCSSRNQEPKVENESNTSTQKNVETKQDSPEDLIVKNNIFIENIEGIQSDSNAYDFDNILFKDQNELKYAYQVFHNDTRKYLFKYEGGCILNAPLTENKDSDPNIIEYLSFRPDAGIKLPGQLNRKYQSITSVWVKFGLKGGLSNDRQVTSVVENKNNIWIHDYWNFHLEFIRLSPNIYIKKPIAIGNKWEFTKTVNIKNLYPEFNLDHNGIYKVNCEYEVIGQRSIKTNFGDLTCFEIKAQAKSNEKESSLIFYFNNDYGFVEMSYSFGDDTILKLSLMK